MSPHSCHGDNLLFGGVLGVMATLLPYSEVFVAASLLHSGSLVVTLGALSFSKLMLERVVYGFRSKAFVMSLCCSCDVGVDLDDSRRDSCDFRGVWVILVGFQVFGLDFNVFV